MGVYAVMAGGASGAIYHRRLIEHLAGEHQVYAVLSPNARLIHREELGTDPAELGKIPGVTLFAHDDFHTPLASGSAPVDGYVIIPASLGQVGRLAAGLSDDLITRAADVALKERRRLILVFRETPLSSLHLENLKRLADAGAVTMAAAPSFYTHPRTVEELVDTVLARVLDHLGIPNELVPRWKGKP